MKEFLWQGAEELATGIIGVLAMAVAGSIINMVFGGWRGWAHCMGLFCVCFICVLMANWGCLHYGLPLFASALVMMVTSIFSFSVLAILFDPAIRKSAVRRISGEILTWRKKDR